jgi:hypothetical protein
MIHGQQNVNFNYICVCVPSEYYLKNSSCHMSSEVFRAQVWIKGPNDVALHVITFSAPSFLVVFLYFFSFTLKIMNKMYAEPLKWLKRQNRS